jgi:hypothetical protein
MSEPLPDSQGKDIVPEALSYAPQEPRQPWWRWRLGSLVLLVVVAAVGLAACGESPKNRVFSIATPGEIDFCHRLLGVIDDLGLCEFGKATEVCMSCGAQTTVHHARLFGVSGRYCRSIHEGPISRLLQEHEKTICTHQWKLGTDTAGGLLWVSPIAGNGIFGLGVVDWLERSANVGAVLQERLRQDPDFPAMFRKHALQGKSMNPFVKELLEQVTGQPVDAS